MWSVIACVAIWFVGLFPAFFILSYYRSKWPVDEDNIIGIVDLSKDSYVLDKTFCWPLLAIAFTFLGTTYLIAYPFIFIANQLKQKNFVGRAVVWHQERAKTKARRKLFSKAKQLKQFVNTHESYRDLGVEHDCFACGSVKEHWAKSPDELLK